MMVIDRASGTITHRMFCDFPGFVGAGDCVVFNNSRVIKARVYSAHGRIELLFLEETEPGVWMCLVRPGKKMRIGARVEVGNVMAEVVGICESGERMVRLSAPLDFDRFGHMPVPPYFAREADAADDERYQTVYAGPQGSVAAPTAGLHFTPELVRSLPHCFVTLHVGAGTFQPVKAERVTDHVMHRERFSIAGDAAERMNAARRIVAVGTTSTRVLESQPPGPIRAGSGDTAIFIHPPFEFQRVGALLTNFHLPKSTLLMLVSAFAGRDLILEAYDQAVREEYRFFSYGDCMLII